jgi:hypothetical protein
MTGQSSMVDLESAVRCPTAAIASRSTTNSPTTILWTLPARITRGSSPTASPTGSVAAISASQQPCRTDRWGRPDLCDRAAIRGTCRRNRSTAEHPQSRHGSKRRVSNRVALWLLQLKTTDQQGSRQNKASLGGDIAIHRPALPACCTVNLFGTASSVCAAQRPAAGPFGGGIVIHRSDCRPGLATLARGAFSEAAPRRGAESNRTVKQRRSI